MKPIRLRLITCIILTISFLHAYSQKQNNVWCFGENAEVDFNSGVPVSNTECHMNTDEGCASIADKTTGQLLFYSSGSVVWDRANNIMPGCTIQLGGNTSTTQSALIIPMPGSTHEYYLFCTAVQAGAGGGAAGDSGTQYCIIDMDLNGGMGDIAQQPVPLLSPTCEKMTATPMLGNQGYWFVVHLWNSDAFYAYPITDTGVGPPVISDAGIIISDPDGVNDNDEAVGYMRISPDRTKIAVATDERVHSLQVFNFNAATGTISGPIFSEDSLSGDHGVTGPYGICWSPNSQFLYFSVEEAAGVWQLNMQAGDSVAIWASLIEVSQVLYPYAMQIGPDNKIYVDEYGTGYLDCIGSPNNGGVACNYQLNAVSLDSGSLCHLGLPEFPVSYTTDCQAYTVNITANQSHICASDSATICAPGGYFAYQWNVTGSDSCILTIQAGSYGVIVTDTNGCSATSNQIIITSSTGVTDSITTEKNIFCSTDSTQICALPGFTSYQWSNGVTTTTDCIEATAAGDYYVMVTDSAGCTVQSNHLSIAAYPVPIVSLTQHGDTLTAFGALSYQWYLDSSTIYNATDSVYIATQPGSYTVEITDTNGCTAVSNPVIITGINNWTEQTISLFPNPTDDKWQLTVENILLGSKLEVFDDNGKTVYESQISNLKTDISFNAASGVYLLRISSGDVNVVRKMVKL